MRDDVSGLTSKPSISIYTTFELIGFHALILVPHPDPSNDKETERSAK